MKISDKGIDFIKQNEGIAQGTVHDGYYHSYWDKIGGVWTIAWGITHIAGLPVGKNTKLSIDGADYVFRDIVAEFDNCVSFLCQRDNVALKQNEYDALVDFAYNLGCRALRNSCLWKAVVKGDKQDVAKQFGRWVYSRGKIIPGLVNRRTKEVTLFIEGRYGS